jgi:hypothetical protein
MSFAKNIPLIVVTVLYFFGRLFESIELTDYETGFLTDTPLVSKVLVVLLVFLIAMSTAVISHGGKNKSKDKFNIKIGLVGFAIGAFFITGAIAGIKNTLMYGGFLGFDIAIIFSGIGFMIYSLVGIKGENIEKFAFIFVTAGGVSFILNALIFDINTVENTIYTSDNLAHIAALSFLMLLFKSQYAPSNGTNIALYRSAFFNTVFSFGGLTATVIGELNNKSTTLYGLLYDCGFILLGILSFSTAVRMSKTSRKIMAKGETRAEVSQNSINNKQEIDIARDNMLQTNIRDDLKINRANIADKQHKGKLSAAMKESGTNSGQKKPIGLNADVIKGLFGPETEDDYTEDLPRVKDRESLHSGNNKIKSGSKVKQDKDKKIFVSNEKQNNHSDKAKKVFTARDSRS